MFSILVMPVDMVVLRYVSKYSSGVILGSLKLKERLKGAPKDETRVMVGGGRRTTGCAS
jgi:hypothetical protein